MVLVTRSESNQRGVGRGGGGAKHRWQYRSCGVRGMEEFAAERNEQDPTSRSGGVGSDQNTGTWASGLRRRGDLDGVAAEILWGTRRNETG